LGDAARLVVTADEVDAVGVTQLEADEEGDCFDAEEAAVDIVACRILSARFDSSRAAKNVPRNK
jgi:hypothetical protein